MSETDTSATVAPNEDVIRASARAWEFDRYLSALLSPRDVRQDLINLAAFAGEIERIPTIVTEPMMGEIRLQWWRDALENTDLSLRSGHPIADAIRDTAARHVLPLGLLMGFIDAQTTKLHDETLADDQALGSHFAKTESALFELALRVVGCTDEIAHTVALSSGQAYGIARLLIELPALWAQGHILIPANRLAAAKLTVAQVRAGVDRDRILPVLNALVAEARRHLLAARRLMTQLSRAQRDALLPLAVVEPYLRAFERVRRDPLREPLEIAPLRRVWALWLTHLRGRF